jgi:hypothetical protein
MIITAYPGIQSVSMIQFQPLQYISICYRLRKYRTSGSNYTLSFTLERTLFERDLFNALNEPVRTESFAVFFLQTDIFAFSVLRHYQLLLCVS